MKTETRANGLSWLRLPEPACSGCAHSTTWRNSSPENTAAPKLVCMEITARVKGSMYFKDVTDHEVCTDFQHQHVQELVDRFDWKGLARALEIPYHDKTFAEQSADWVAIQFAALFRKNGYEVPSCFPVHNLDFLE